jgi:hypothetical protein
MMISPVETHGKLDFPKEQENTFLKGKITGSARTWL